MKAIVIGASSGIGRELTKILIRNGYKVGIVARRIDLLQSLQKELNSSSIIIKQSDISDSEKSRTDIENLIQELGGIDLAILNAAVGFQDEFLNWEKTRKTIEINVLGFCALANTFMRHFIFSGKGHLVGISSIAALRGSGCYSASKAFVSNYLEGLRHNMARKHKQIFVTDIKPGFVDTAMARSDHLFWVAPADKAAELIYKKIKKRKSHAYITPRWRIIAWILKFMPNCIYDAFF